MRQHFALPALALLSACAGTGMPSPAGPSVGTAPYAAVQNPLPADDNRIYLAGASAGRITIRDDCILFERLNGDVVLPVFEHGVTAGRDARGGWLYDPESGQYFRDGTKVRVGGGGEGESVAALSARLSLAQPVPARCSAALTRDVTHVMNPGIIYWDFDE